MNDTKDQKSTGAPVQKTASVHETTVQAIAKGEVAPRPRRARKAPQRRVQPVHTHIVVDRRVLAAAKKLLTGSYSKIEIIDHETVVVR